MKYKNIKITKRNDNRWQARYLENGTYKYIYDKTQQGCYNKLKEVLKDKKQIVKSNTLNDWIDTWLSLYKLNKVKKVTFDKIKATINKYITNTVGKKDITKIKVIDIELLLNNIKGGRIKQIVYTYLKDIFNKALKNEIVKKDICVLLDKPKHNKKESKAFSLIQQKAFINECNKFKYGDFFLILLFQGMRKGELLALESSDIDFNTKTIKINKSLNEQGKITTPKTESSIREIPIFKSCENILIKYKNKDGRIFPITKNPIFKEFKEIMNNLKLTGFTVHSLRHTFVTRWTEKGAPSKLIQKWVGHADNNITEKVYTKINKDYELSFLTQKDVNFDTDFDTDF